MASATVIYLVEIRADIPSLAHAIWLAIVTMTTVGDVAEHGAGLGLGGARGLSEVGDSGVG